MQTTMSEIPMFDLSLRGYDRLQVDEYLESIQSALDDINEAQEQNRRLQAHIARLNERIAELEGHIQADPPLQTVIAGNRISSLLQNAEETVASIIAEAHTVAQGIEASARAEAAEIKAEADCRAARRTQETEAYVEEAQSRVRAMEARAEADLENAKRQAELVLAGLAAQRDEAAAAIRALWEKLGEAVGMSEAWAGQVGQPAAPAALPGAGAAIEPGAGELVNETAAEAVAESEPDEPEVSGAEASTVPAGSEADTEAAADEPTTAWDPFSEENDDDLTGAESELDLRQEAWLAESEPTEEHTPGGAWRFLRG